MFEMQITQVKSRGGFDITEETASRLEDTAVRTIPNKIKRQKIELIVSELWNFPRGKGQTEKIFREVLF